MNRIFRTFALTGLLAVLGFSRSASAQVDPRKDAPLVRLSLGLRGQWIGSAGLDPFTNGDFMAQSSIGADVTVLRTRRLSFAVGVLWDFGMKSGDARGVDMHLALHRVTLPLEARWHWTRAIYGFARLAPGFTTSLARASSLEANVGPYRDTRHAVAGDLSAGVAFALSPRSRYQQGRAVRLWAIPEIGYALAGKTSFDLKPSTTRPGSDVPLPGTTLPTQLPAFSASGPFFRLSLALGF